MRTLRLLLCAIGWHHAAPGGRWNRGYCFSRCVRCGRDMIRGDGGEWRVPSGYRVVWKRRDEVLPARSPRTSANPPGLSQATTFPADFMNEESEASDWFSELPHQLPVQLPTDPGDFMDDPPPRAAAPPTTFRSRR